MIEVYWCYEDQNHHVKFQDSEMAEAEFLAWEIFQVMKTIPTITFPMPWSLLNPEKMVRGTFGGYDG